VYLYVYIFFSNFKDMEYLTFQQIILLDLFTRNK